MNKSGADLSLSDLKTSMQCRQVTTKFNVPAIHGVYTTGEAG
jgi:hypothetical protein